MNNVAIMTINSINFGNRLQNYALQETLRDLGYEVETVRRADDLNKVEGNRERIKNLLRELKV